MPFSTTTLTQSGTALTAEMKTPLDNALTGSGKFTRVTTGYTSATRSYDVWLNDGTTDGYQWYLIVMTDTANTGRVLLGGALEYDPGTQIAKKALRGTAVGGFTDTSGYPLVSSGGAEMTFALGSFVPTTLNTVGCVGGVSTAPTTAATGMKLRILVTGQVAWINWGADPAATFCHGVGTYQKLHDHPGDAKPLAFICGQTFTDRGGTVWQHPAAAGIGARSTFDYVLHSSGSTDHMNANLYSITTGFVNTGPDRGWDNYLGSRYAIIRSSVGSTFGGGANVAISGQYVGLAPADFLLFQRAGGVPAIGYNMNIDGKVYTLVTPTNASGGICLFVNTQPSV